MQGEDIIEFAAEGSRNHRPCLKHDLSYNQTDQAIDIKGEITDSFGLELNLRQLNDVMDLAGQKDILGTETERMCVIKKVSDILICR